MTCHHEVTMATKDTKVDPEKLSVVSVVSVVPVVP